MFLMLGSQNKARLIIVLVSNVCQAVRSDVRPCLDKDDGPLIDNLWEMIFPRQNIYIAASSFVGLL